MGQQAITIVLIDATPYRLRYRLTDFGNGGNVILTNRGLAEATPDLRGDCARAAAANGMAGTPLLTQVSLGVANQAEARHVLNGHNEAGVQTPALANVIRAHCRVVGRTGRNDWDVDVNEGFAAGDAPSTGFPVVLVGSDGVAGTTAILDIHLTHTHHDSQ
ncbi:MAG: hypothetical protein JSV86_17045 [Gemmatimonadota bacterium]|nr:MAG: hypothetical protein JSV86_17045 [Gemmatimonadota bacterium]